MVEERVVCPRDNQILSFFDLLPVLAEEHEHEDGQEEASSQQAPSSNDDSITGGVVGRLDTTVAVVSA